jgi:uncharacterized membrane protein
MRAHLIEWMENLATAIEFAGVVFVALSVIVPTARFLLRPRGPLTMSLRRYRHELGQGILLGLELLVAADIVATVIASPTLAQLSALGVIVLIRTFLSLSLQIELEGRWPWQPLQEMRHATNGATTASSIVVHDHRA